jgi:hypothetical protein
MEILPESSSFSEFVRGFNMSEAMCDYVDAGNGKECADEKVKGNPISIKDYFTSADLTKRIFDSIWPTSTARKFFSVVQLIMGTPVFLGRSSMMRQSVNGSPCLTGLRLLKN